MYIVSPFVTICITTEHASLSQTGQQKHFFFPKSPAAAAIRQLCSERNDESRLSI